MTAKYPSQELFNLRKTGKTEDAWQFGIQAMEQNPTDEYLKGAFFWVCFDKIKVIQSRIHQRAAQSKSFTPSPQEQQELENILSHIIRLDIPASPERFEYKQLIIQCKKNIKDLPQLIFLILKHQENMFDEDARTPYKFENKEFPSLMLEAARGVAKAFLATYKNNVFNPQLVEVFIRKTQELAHDKTHMIWLNYDYAKFLIASNRMQDAQRLLTPILQEKQSESWAWHSLAETYLHNNSDIALQLFAKSIMSAHKIHFASKSVAAIIPLLVQRELHVEASICLKSIVNLYQKEGWNIPNAFINFLQQDWYQDEIEDTDLRKSLQPFTKDVYNFLYDTILNCNAIVESIHKSQKGFKAYIDKETSLHVSCKIQKNNISVGDYLNLSVAVTDSDSKVLSFKKTNETNITGASIIKGELRITDKGFGFVDDVFFPPFLVSNLKNNQTISALSIESWDKSKNRFGQKAIKIISAEESEEDDCLF